MTPTTGHSVMDLLLGKIAPRQSTGMPLQTTGQTVESSGFADLLGILAGLQSAGPELLSGEPQSLDENGVTLGETVNGNENVISTILGSLVSGGQTGAKAPTIIGLNAGYPIGRQETDPLATATNARPEVVTAQQSSTSMSGVMQLPHEAVVANPQILALLNQIPAELPTGKFAVLKSRVNDGILQMEVASQEAPNQMIKLTIPTALLRQTSSLPSNPAASTAVGIASQLTNGNRVPLTDPFAATERFDELLSKANVKEIEIAPSPISALDIRNTSSVAVALTAESNGLPINISGRMNKNQIVATKNRRIEGLLDSRADAKSHAAFETEQSTTIEAGNRSTTVVTAGSDGSIVDTIFTSGKAPDNSSFSFSHAESPVMLSKGTRHSRSVSASVVERPAVKLTLQQELPNLAQLEGRTLMIKLEPEYLGPARLHLTMRDDTLSARVMVETPSAKSAVESSLSQLTDQLTKAGIKVDYIDVGVRGGGAHNQFFHRQTDWYREQNPRIMQHEQYDNVLTEAATVGTTYTRPNHVSADRVNIYA